MSREHDVLAEHVAMWLRRANRDLGAAALDLSVEPPFLADAVFHCQQAAEKALKGLLAAHARVFGKTHIIEDLAPDLLASDATLEPILRRASRLTVYAWKFRYPGEADEPPLAEAREALEIARAVVAAVEERIARS
ncbi:MAG TPA: HEPN domain-containing protein [Coriobacteriia bacterium]